MRVLGTELYDKGFDTAVEELIQFSKLAQENKLISASDAHVLVTAKTQPEFKEILQSFYWNLPDGVPSVWLMKWKGAKEANRISGPQFFEAVIKATKNMNINHFLCGGAEGVAQQLKVVCESWGNQNVVGTLSPPFRAFLNTDYIDIGEKIIDSRAHIVWIGLGAPKQIYFANELKKHTNVQGMVTIGAAFDFHTQRVKKAPKWIQKIGLEWLFRLYQEPKRLFKRYFKTVPYFIWYALGDVILRKKK
ncbi:MAG: WecB/TagA/CpsF family glycosyltransferase [Crocinitomicaceae bacterium]